MILWLYLLFSSFVQKLIFIVSEKFGSISKTAMCLPFENHVVGRVHVDELVKKRIVHELAVVQPTQNDVCSKKMYVFFPDHNEWSNTWIALTGSVTVLPETLNTERTYFKNLQTKRTEMVIQTKDLLFVFVFVLCQV